MLVADGFADPAVQAKVIRLVELGIRWVQLRDHKASLDDFDAAAMRLSYQLSKVNRRVLISVNSWIQIAEQHELPFHTGTHGPTLFESRLVLGTEAPIGLSVHDGKELATAVRDGASYITFSPVFKTDSHPEAKPVGTTVLRNACRHATMPVIAMGGIMPANVKDCLEAGAHGVAVVSSLLSSNDMVGAVQAFNAELPGL